MATGSITIGLAEGALAFCRYQSGEKRQCNSRKIDDFSLDWPASCLNDTVFNGQLQPMWMTTVVSIFWEPNVTCCSRLSSMLDYGGAK